MYQLSSSTLLKAPHRQLSPDHNMVQVAELSASHEREVMDFLARRPIHTVGMVGLIYDNGLVSPFNRGTFYGCRNLQGQLEGVALIGHATLMETTSDRALEALARIAQTCTTGHMIMGEQERINEFWDYYAEAGQQMRRACREMLFELRWPVEARAEVGKEREDFGRRIGLHRIEDAGIRHGAGEGEIVVTDDVEVEHEAGSLRSSGGEEVEHALRCHWGILPNQSG